MLYLAACKRHCRSFSRGTGVRFTAFTCAHFKRLLWLVQIKYIYIYIYATCVHTGEAGRELGVEGLVAVELGELKLFHVETGEVGVQAERVDVVESGQRLVGQQRRGYDGDVEQEIGLARCLDDHAHLHTTQTTTPRASRVTKGRIYLRGYIHARVAR